jgi:hypothetical protein
MSRNQRFSLRLLAATMLAALATAAISVGTALAGGGGGPFPH